MKKNTLTLLTIILTVLLLAISATALSAPATLDITQQPNDDFSQTITITNDGNTTLTNLNVGIAPLSGFNLNASPSNIASLAAGATQVITVQGFIPEDIDTRDNPFTSTLTVSDGSTSTSTTINVNGKSQLKLKNVEFEYEEDTADVDDGDEIDEIRRGETITITGEIENLFDDREREYDIQIEDIEVFLLIEDIDDGDNIDEDISVGDIDADKDDTFEFEIDIPNDAEDDEYDAILEVEGEDENGAIHYLRWDLTITVEREKDDIRITEAFLDRDVLSCDRRTTLTVEVTNYGSRDQDDVSIKVENNLLDISERVRPIELDEDPDKKDNDYKAIFNLEFGDDELSGTYDLIIDTFIDGDDLMDEDILRITINDCKDTTTTTPQAPIENIVEQHEQAVGTTTPITTPPIVTGGATIPTQAIITQSTENTSLRNALFVLLLVLANIAAIAAAVFLITLSTKKK
ncbi:hypothetical protein GOV04_01590 [Candidatus Woesearchaeota archaeon]|nr:hypothetical protein [Candidatus Woesearchaeota archaeon]